MNINSLKEDVKHISLHTNVDTENLLKIQSDIKSDFDNTKLML